MEPASVTFAPPQGETITQPRTRGPVRGRSCGTCSLCCKLIHVAELNKPMGQWCPHCLKSGGCGIYETRPNVCRDWFCEWIANPNIGDEWRPLSTKMVMIVVNDGGAQKLVVHVDQGSPLAWKKEPHYSDIKRWASEFLERGGMVNIYVGGRVVVVLPDRDVDLGPFKFGDRINLRRTRMGDGWTYDAFKIPGEASAPDR
jgi:hypothetical protein